MGRNLSPMLRRELANLEKDADSRKSAMKALKSYVKELDSKAIPLFLAQVSETKEPGSSGEYTISLYEVLARVHGHNIVPQIDNIMSTIIKTLTSSAGSFPLQQACSKVVPAIARYGIDPAITPDKEKSKIIYSLCKPLSDALMGSPESLASGAALCLKALVESDNWRFASDDIVNEVCLRVAGALEENFTQTNSHMGLAMSLAKHNGLIVEAYARSLVRSGIRILKGGLAEVNSQKRFSAVQMINFLMKSIDSGSIYSELAAISEAMEKCQADRMPFVRGAAFEALQTSRDIAVEKGSKYEKDSSLIAGSNLSRRRNLWGIKDSSNAGSCSNSPRFASPESQTINSFIEYDAFPESPLSIGQSVCNFECGRSVNRKLWRNENGGVDVSLKDGLYSEARIDDNCSRKYFDHFGDDEQSDLGRDRADAFLGFSSSSPASVVMRSETPSPQRQQSHLTIDDLKIFTTPRKLIRSLQDPNDVDSEFFEKKGKGFGSSNGNEVEQNSARRLHANGLHHNLNYEVEGKMNSDAASMMSWCNNVEDGELEPDGPESVSSTSDVPVEVEDEVSHELGGSQVKDEVQSGSVTRKSFGKAAFSLVCGLSMILPAVILSAMWIENQEECFNLVPT